VVQHMEFTYENFKIKYVAIYLRKSRGESEKDLDNHKNALIEICERNGWEYDIFEEIVSGESLELRPKAQELLYYLENEPDSYDAILVMDIDRLSRAGTSESDLVKKLLIDSETLLVIKDRIMDLSNEQDDITYDIQSFVAKLEYKMIKKRLRQGKFQNAKKGYWSNGIPPIPYLYNKEARMLSIDETLLRTYRYIIDSVVIDRKSTNQIAYELNQKGWLTAGKKGKRYWTSKTVRDTLLDKTHLQYSEETDRGCIVIGKSKGNGHKKRSSIALKFKRIPQDKWLTFKGLHKSLKTQEEHTIIEVFLKRKTKAPRKTTAKTIFPLTGLIKCGCCGHYLGFTERSDRKGLLSVKNCWYKDPFGNKCHNRSSPMLVLIDKIHELIEKHIADVQYEIDTIDNDRITAIEDEIKTSKRLVEVKDTAIDRVDEAYEAGAYSVDELKMRKGKLKSEKGKILEDIKALEVELNYLRERGKTERVDALKEFKELIAHPDLTWEEQNELYKTLIEYVVYTKVDEKIKIQVVYR